MDNTNTPQEKIKTNLPDDFRSGHQILLDEHDGVDIKAQIPKE